MSGLLTGPVPRRASAAPHGAAAAAGPPTTATTARESVLARSLAQVAAASPAAMIAAAFSLSAGIVHLGYTQDHWWLWWVYGIFFLGSGLLQTGLAVALMAGRVGTWIASAAIVGNLATICLYVISRTPYGAPMGPMRGHAELPGLVDMGTTIGELITVIALLTFLPRRAVRWVTTLLLVVGAALWALRLTEQLTY
jgi:hypothetical protein